MQYCAHHSAYNLLSVRKAWVGVGQPRFARATNYWSARRSQCVTVMCLRCVVLQGGLAVGRSWRHVQRMVSHSTVRWEGGKVHLSLKLVWCSQVTIVFTVASFPGFFPHGDAFGESLGTRLSSLYVYRCSKPGLFLINGRCVKPLVKEKLSCVVNSSNEDWQFRVCWYEKCR